MAEDNQIPFSDTGPSVVDFPSNWKAIKQTRELEIHTDPIPTGRAEVQTKERIHKEVQTTPETLEVRLLQNPDLASVKGFLNSVLPLVENQLEKNLRSRAFDEYVVYWEDQISTITTMFELIPSQDFTAASSNVSVTGLSWNATGAVIAVAYGRFDHSGWCVHTGSICTWNVFKRKMDPKKPDLLLETQNCAMSVEFHPKEPSLLAAGTFNGQLIIYDLNQTEDQLVAMSGLNDDTHYEAITKIAWIPTATKKQSSILTISTDGKVLMWELIQKLDLSWKLDLVQGFHLIIGKSSTGPVLTGGTALSLNSEDTSTFIVGTEGGRVNKCTATNVSHDKKEDKKITLTNPVTFMYESHAGPVNSVQFSPFHRNVFLTSGCDTNVRVYNMLKQKAVLALVPTNSYIYSVSWSPFRPLVFAVGTGDGKVFFYDLKKSRTKPAATIEAGTFRSAVQVIQFNPKSRMYCASGDNRGVTKIYTLNSLLTQEQPQEKQILATLYGGAQASED